MAKKRKAKRKTGRRRRVSGINATSLQLPAGVLAGAAGSKVLVENLATRYPDIKPNIVSGAQVVIGWFLSKQRNPLIAGAGLGMLANGGIGALQSFGIVSGVGNVGASNLVTFRRTPELNGMENVLSGNNGDEDLNDMQILAGVM